MAIRWTATATARTSRASAAGNGVNADGTTFAGPYGPSTPFSSLRIGPGSAPQAQLYALRVFGCGGGTNLTVQAIDWATDPNGDNDMSDRLDVINMSLGSALGIAHQHHRRLLPRTRPPSA